MSKGIVWIQSTSWLRGDLLIIAEPGMEELLLNSSEELESLVTAEQYGAATDDNIAQIAITDKNFFFILTKDSLK